MNRSLLVLTLVGFATSAWASAPLSHADRMRKCAAQWQTHKHSSVAKARYQQFMSECMKSVAATGPSKSRN